MLFRAWWCHIFYTYYSIEWQWTGTPCTRPGCSGLHLSWPWTLPGIGHPQLLWTSLNTVRCEAVWCEFCLCKTGVEGKFCLLQNRCQTPVALSPFHVVACLSVFQHFKLSVGVFTETCHFCFSPAAVELLSFNSWCCSLDSVYMRCPLQHEDCHTEEP